MPPILKTLRSLKFPQVPTKPDVLGQVGDNSHTVSVRGSKREVSEVVIVIILCAYFSAPFSAEVKVHVHKQTDCYRSDRWRAKIIIPVIPDRHNHQETGTSATKDYHKFPKCIEHPGIVREYQHKLLWAAVHFNMHFYKSSVRTATTIQLKISSVCHSESDGCIHL